MSKITEAVSNYKIKRKKKKVAKKALREEAKKVAGIDENDNVWQSDAPDIGKNIGRAVGGYKGYKSTSADTPSGKAGNAVVGAYLGQAVGFGAGMVAHKVGQEYKIMKAKRKIKKNKKK